MRIRSQTGSHLKVGAKYCPDQRGTTCCRCAVRIGTTASIANAGAVATAALEMPPISRWFRSVWGRAIIPKAVRLSLMVTDLIEEFEWSRCSFEGSSKTFDEPPNVERLIE